MSAQNDQLAKLIASQSRAREIIRMDVGGKLDNLKNNAINNNKMSYGENGEVTYNYTKPSQQRPISQNAITKSKLPKAILESIQENPIEEPVSILDSIDESVFTAHRMEQEPAVQQVEQTTQSVDYSMIKMIVEDCMKKYMSAIKKSIITENKKSNDTSDNVKAIRLDPGNKFAFVTDDGDLYEARLKFVKNVNSIKKGGN